MITDLDKLIDGLANGASPPRWFCKSSAPGQTVGRLYAFWADTGPVAAGAYDNTLAGVTVVGPAAGGIPYIAAASGRQGYLGGFTLCPDNTGYQFIIADRLWHNGNLSATSTSAQTINSTTWPARDANGSTNGVGVQVGVEIESAMGASSPSTITVTYTNSAGTGSRSASLMDTQSLTSAGAGSFWRMKLADGDVGVRSIQSVQLGATWTSGTWHLVAYRVLHRVLFGTAFRGRNYGPMHTGMPRIYDGCSPFLINIPLAGTGVRLFNGMMITPQA